MKYEENEICIVCKEPIKIEEASGWSSKHGSFHLDHGFIPFFDEETE